jgi:hypothetical protein
MSNFETNRVQSIPKAFAKFNKICNSSNSGHINRIFAQQPNDTVFCHQEKCHCANFNVVKKVCIKHKKTKIFVRPDNINISDYVNQARFDSALSKIGIESANIHNMGNEVLRDIVIDYMEDNLGTDQVHLKKSANLVVYQFVKKMLAVNTSE